VHGPEQFQSEGLAQSLTYFLDTPASRDPFLAANRELKTYKRMLENNLHIMINSGQSIEDCVAYGAEHMPFQTRNEIAHSLASKSNKPQFRCYEDVYGPGAVFFKKMAQQADPRQKQVILNRIYNEWLSAGELAAFSEAVLKPSQGAQAPRP